MKELFSHPDEMPLAHNVRGRTPYYLPAGEQKGYSYYVGVASSGVLKYSQR